MVLYHTMDLIQMDNIITLMAQQLSLNVKMDII